MLPCKTFRPVAALALVAGLFLALPGCGGDKPKADNKDNKDNQDGTKPLVTDPKIDPKTDPKVDPIKPPETPAATAEDGGKFVDPIVAYKNRAGNPGGGTELKGTSVTGGYVYRGKAIPTLEGKYVFADWTRNPGVADGVVIVATRPKDGSAQWPYEALTVDNLPNGKLAGYVTAMGEDEAGELYVLLNGRNAVTGKTGKVYKIVPAGTK